jgi:hypothetical protein
LRKKSRIPHHADQEIKSGTFLGVWIIVPAGT